jgi:hypothetical protein
MKNMKPLLSALVAATVVLTQATARADSAANITGTYVPNQAVTYDDNGSGNFPVITAILSAPHGSVYNPTASLDGYTNNNWSFLAQDTTGSLDLFYFSSLNSGFTPAGYVPVVGDTILAQGNYSPFSGIPEIANSAPHPLSVTYGSSGNPFYTPVPTVTTIPVINVGTNGHGLSLSGLGGTLLELDNVTISGAGANWAFHQNVTGTITDLGANSMTMFLWASSYSTCAAIAAGGGPVPTGLVDMTGFISDFYNTATSTLVAEFVPISITSVPEPVSMTLWGLGSALAWVCYRLRKRA